MAGGSSSAQQPAVQQRAVSDLKPHPKNDDIYGVEDLPEEFVDSIDEHGIREPLVITPTSRIISGHRRYQAAKSLEMEAVPVRVREFESELAEWEALLDYNRQRKKTPGQIVNEFELQMEIEQERAKDRMSEGGKGGVERDGNVSNPSDSGQPARDKAAEKFDHSGRTIEKGVRVKEAAEAGDETAQEEWEKMQEGQQSFHGAYETVAESGDAPDDADERDEPAEDSTNTNTCPVCGDEWVEYREALDALHNETVAVEKVCVVDGLSNVVLHIPETDLP